MKKNLSKIIQVGNSLGITLTKNFLKENKLKKGDFIRVENITFTKFKIKIEEVKETSLQKKLPTQQEVKK